MKKILFFSLIILAGCNKSKFLDANPNQALVIPQTLNQVQVLLDNDNIMNGALASEGLIPSIGESSADNFFLLKTDYDRIAPTFKEIYHWDKNAKLDNKVYDWSIPYRCVFYSNIALEALAKLKPTSNTDVTRKAFLSGTALFHRAHMFYQLAQAFSPAYNKNTAGTDKGIPLRNSADINEVLSRATLADTYEKIIVDLKLSTQLLPATTEYKTRPSKAAAYALLARTFLTMNDYKNALEYSDSCLKLYNKLLDYNQYNTASNTPFGPPPANDEIIFYATLIGYNNICVPSQAKIDTTLYPQYHTDDLRRSLFFRPSAGYMRFKGSYEGTTLFGLFGGIATNEIYLIRAECYARQDATSEAMADLNTLLIKRWKKDLFTPLTANNADDAKAIILRERRKELVFRGLRWTDLKRLNSEPGFETTQQRIIAGTLYTLPPNDPRYTLPIPEDVINSNANIEQNIR